MDTLFDEDPAAERGAPSAPRGRAPPASAAGRSGAPARASRSSSGSRHLLGDGLGPADRDRAGPAPLDAPLRAPGVGQDDARADRRGRLRRRLRGAERGAGRARRGARGDRAGRPPPRQAAAPQTILFLDEIHRFNKAQQDALLPAVEEGLLTLIGATTENPAFEVNGALLSRMRVYALQALSAEELETVLLRRPPADSPEVEPEALSFLAARSEGDARTALNALELAAETAAELGEGRSRWSGSRTPCSAGRSSSTNRATATTTTSPPGSRRRAARIPTPRCTTWP